ncbi:MAG: hypothetical protein KDI63_08175 [Gammaproteobacteria bacterium]|nr:hypothetical protein [Gammaproteobacteria bacterium]
MSIKNPQAAIGRSSLKEGPVVYQAEDSLLEDDRRKKDLTLAELNHLFKLYLSKQHARMEDISILGQFSVIFNDPRFAVWHTMSKGQQSDALTEIVNLPEVCGDLIGKIGSTAGDQQIVGSVIKDAYQNAIDSFSHAAYIQQRYINHFPGFKVILFLNQRDERMVLVLIDNGFGSKVTKPKKLHTGQEYGDDFISRFVDWMVRRYVEKEGDVNRNIAYTGGQGMAFKKIRIELKLDVELHFFSNGAIFELKLKNFF